MPIGLMSRVRQTYEDVGVRRYYRVKYCKHIFTSQSEIENMFQYCSRHVISKVFKI